LVLSYPTSNTQGFLQRRKRVQLTFCKEPFVFLISSFRPPS